MNLLRTGVKAGFELNLGINKIGKTIFPFYTLINRFQSTGNVYRYIDRYRIRS
jgi:hypothetical protein